MRLQYCSIPFGPSSEMQKFRYFVILITIMKGISSFRTFPRHKWLNPRDLAPRRTNQLSLFTRNARSDQLEKYKFDTNGRENNELEMLTAYWKKVLLKHLPVLISSLDRQYHFQDDMPPHFSKAFLKGQSHHQTARRWIEKHDSSVVKLKKTVFIIDLLKEVDEKCFEEHETRYSCPGFFQLLFQILDLQLKNHSQSVLSEFELEKYLAWCVTAGEIFATNLYRKLYRLPE
jgi:hypothetical protein